jgi:hypothetical protein
MNNYAAVSRYISHIENIKAMLDALQQYANDFGDVCPDDVTYATVGDVARIAELLTEACTFAGVSVAAGFEEMIDSAGLMFSYTEEQERLQEAQK